MSTDELDLLLGSYDGDLHDLLAALDLAGLIGALLVLDGDARELHDFIEERTVGEAALHARNRKARRSYRRLGALIFGGRPLTLPIESDTLKELRDLAERFVGPEIAICISVRERDGTLLIEAPDIGSSEIWANSSRLPTAGIDALRKALGPTLN